MPHPSIYNEKELLLRVAEGDEKAFILLHDHYFDKVYYAGLSFLKSPDLAMDTLQDIFFNLWRKREMLRTVENFAAFLMVMVRNELINALQRNTRREQVYKEYSLQLPTNFMSSDEQLEYKQLELLIKKAIEALSPQQQLIYRLTREEGLSHAAIAERLGLSAKTIANTITLILNHLRVYLSTHGKEYIWLLIFFL